MTSVSETAAGFECGAARATPAGGPIQGAALRRQDEGLVEEDSPPPLEGGGWGEGSSIHRPGGSIPPPSPLPQGEGESLSRHGLILMPIGEAIAVVRPWMLRSFRHLVGTHVRSGCRRSLPLARVRAACAAAVG